MHCKFVDCVFEACDLSGVKIANTSFNEVVFDGCKLLGINWTQAKWPYIALTSPIKFYNSNISYSSFYELSLTEIIIETCNAKGVDFREGRFDRGNFRLTDLEGSLFTHSSLIEADFTGAYNYNINPSENKIAKAKFSLPDALNLLGHFDVELVEN